MINVQRFYVNGKLERTTKPNTIEQLRKWIDNTEREWSKNLDEIRTNPEAFRGFNQGREVSRVSIDELLVTTTENKKLRWINVERKS